MITGEIYMKIAFVGGGHMATALVGGLYKNNAVRHIVVIDRNAEKRDMLQSEFGD